MSTHEKLKVVSVKLAELKNSLNARSGLLSLLDYDMLYGDIEELQVLVLEVEHE